MKFRYLAALFMGASLIANAQGYKDGIEYYKAGQYDNAITILTKNMNSPETNKALANYYLGQSYLSQGDKAKAKQYFEAGIAADANCGYNYVGLGALDLLAGNKSAAEDNFKKAQSLEKKNSEVTIDIARAYFNADPVTYAKEIDKKVEQARKDSKGKEVALYIFEGDRQAKQRNFNEAASWYEQATSIDSQSPESYVKYANVYFYQNPQYAIQRLQELLKINPTSALAQRELAEKYYENGQLTKAAAQYGQYMANPNHFAQDKARYAVLLFADKKYPEAVKTAREVLKDMPNDLTMDRIVVLSLNEMNDKEAALNAATQYFNNKEYAGRYNVGDYLTYAQLLTDAGKAAEAEALLRQAYKALPEEKTILQVLADALNKEGKYGEAVDTYDQYLQVVESPSTQDYNNGSIYALAAVSDEKATPEMRKKYSDMGVGYLNKIIDPANPRVSYSLRKVQILLNRNPGAVDADGASAIRDLIAILDSDSSYADPSNADNTLNVYRLLYNQLVSYYNSIGDKNAAADANAQFKKYDALYNSIK